MGKKHRLYKEKHNIKQKLQHFRKHTKITENTFIQKTHFTKKDNEMTFLKTQTKTKLEKTN